MLCSSESSHDTCRIACCTRLRRCKCETTGCRQTTISGGAVSRSRSFTRYKRGIRWINNVRTTIFTLTLRTIRLAMFSRGKVISIASITCDNTTWKASYSSHTSVAEGFTLIGNGVVVVARHGTATARRKCTFVHRLRACVSCKRLFVSSYSVSLSLLSHQYSNLFGS